MLPLLLTTSLTSQSSLYKKTLSREMLEQTNNHCSDQRRENIVLLTDKHVVAPITQDIGKCIVDVASFKSFMTSQLEKGSARWRFLLGSSVEIDL